MITLKEWMEVSNYRITEGSDYCWDCFGPNAYSLTSWSGDQDGYSLCILFDTKTQEVYQVEAHDYARRRSYRRTNPEYLRQYEDEQFGHGVEDEAYDGVKFVDLESDDDFIEKALAIVAGEDYDDRVTIPLDLTDKEQLVLFRMAHDRDMSFNEFVIYVLDAKLKDLDKQQVLF